MLQLITPDISHKKQWEEIMTEWGNHLRKNPRIFFQNTYEDFLDTMNRVRDADDEENKIPRSSYYFLYDNEKEKILGFYTFRHNLNFWDDAINGGHIGYGIRPSARQAGYGKKGLELVLGAVKRLGFSEVYVSCDDENIGSWKIIEANGGVLEKFCHRHDVKTRRYRIDLFLKEKQFLKNLEIELLQYETRQNRERLNQLLADDFFECGASGDRFGKQECLESLSLEPREKTFEYSDMEVYMISPEIGQVRWQARITNPGKDPKDSFRTSLWRKAESGWQMFFHQGTLLNSKT